MWACKKCGKSNYDNSYFCVNCGFPKNGQKPKRTGLIAAITSTCILISSVGIAWGISNASERKKRDAEATPVKAAESISPSPSADIKETPGVTSVHRPTPTPTIKPATTPTPAMKPTPTPHVHYYSWAASRYPTCDEAGYDTGMCSCGDTKTRTTAALGHNYVNDICTRCGNINGEHYHDYSWLTVQSPTCTQDGYQIGTCNCGETVYIPLNASGHEFVNGFCCRCGEADGSSYFETGANSALDDGDYYGGNSNTIDLSTAFNEDFAAQMQAILDEMKSLD